MPKGDERVAGICEGSSRSALRQVAAAALCTTLVVLTLPLPAGAQSSGAETRRISGPTVYDIAAKAAGTTCDSKIGSHSIALASGENWPDALAGSALDRPLLLTPKAFLPAPTRAYLEPCRSHPKAKVIILGGQAAVSSAVEQDLSDMGFRVDRIVGADRYETAHRVARLFAPDELPNVFLASGKNYADAVAAAPSVSRNTPLILTAPRSLGDQARQFLAADDRSIGRVTILGGNAAVSETVEDEVRSLGLATRRIAGADRYDTAALIAREAFGVSGCHPVRDVAVASGTSPYGGLAASAVRGPCQPLLLTPKAGQDVPASLVSFGGAWKLSAGDLADASVTGIGSPSQVPDQALEAVATGVPPGPASGTGSGSRGDNTDWDRLAASVVQVVCLDTAGTVQASGSGFVVGNGRQVVTNHHVVVNEGNRACPGISVRVGGTFSTAPTRTATANVVRATRARDLALLSLDSSGDPLPSLDIGTVTPRAGDEITVLGYPGVGGDTMTLTRGRYSGTTQLDGQVWVKTDAQISPGNSGGPAFDAQGRLVGVATAVNPIRFSDRADIVGTLGLMVPAVDVAALRDGTLDGTLSGTPETDPVGDGEWNREFTTSGRDPYVALLAEASEHSMTGLYADLEPGLFIFCDDRVGIDFWEPVTRRWRQGPYISGQIDFRNRDKLGRVPVAYRIGGEHNALHRDLWWPTIDNRGVVAGDRGAVFVTHLLAGTGSLALGWTNWDDSTEVIVFPSMDGFSSAYEHLETHCN